MNAAEIGMPTETRADGGKSFGSWLAGVRQYWWIVLVVVWLVVLGALLATARTPTTYLGRTSLTVSSSNRSPEQDAVLVQGYASYFDNAAYQQQLLDEAKVDTKTLVSAEAAAASPILIISATGADPDRAQSSAVAVAEAFRADINKAHDQKIAETLATLQDDLDTARGRNGKNDQVVIAALQDEIRQLQANQDNVLQELQLRGGVTAQPPSLLSNLLLAFVGGLILGVLAALALDKFSPRLRTRHDLMEKVGLDSIVELPSPRARGAQFRRQHRLRQLANLVRAKLTKAGVVAVTQATDGAATPMVAGGIAMELAMQGYATVWVRFNRSTEPQAQTSSLTLLDDPANASAILSKMRAGPVPGMSILDLSPIPIGDAPRASVSEIAELLKLAELTGAFVIVEAPKIMYSATAHAVTLAADATILVIDTQVATVAETREAVGVLRESGVVLLGAVLAPAPSESNADRGDPGDSSAHRPASAETGLAPTTGEADWLWWSTSQESDHRAQPDRNAPGETTESVPDPPRQTASDPDRISHDDRTEPARMTPSNGVLSPDHSILEDATEPIRVGRTGASGQDVRTDQR